MEAIKTEREKQLTEVPVEESFPVREAAPLDGADDPMVPSDENWAVKLEQSVNIFLTVINTSSTTRFPAQFSSTFFSSAYCIHLVVALHAIYAFCRIR